jgi:hypothetical protein
LAPWLKVERALLMDQMVLDGIIHVLGRHDIAVPKTPEGLAV